jgi:hypothetical protein
MARHLLVLLVALLPVAALAGYPDDCLGPATPSAQECPPALTFDGCCDAAGRVVFCQGGKLFCLDCPGLSPHCGWKPGKAYNCGTDGSPDPSGLFSPVCDLCQPACGPGESCQNGQCQACLPACMGKSCGFDGCGGSCGSCPLGQWCQADQQCSPAPQCAQVADLTCGETVAGSTLGVNDHLSGYACTKTETDGGELAYTITPAVDDLLRFALTSKGDASLDMHLTHSQCTPDACFASKWQILEVPVQAGVPYFLIIDGKAGGEGEFELTLTCQSDCQPDCAGKSCGPDGCFGLCGDCDAPEECYNGACFANDGCTPTYLKGCGACVCEDCVCAADSWCCEVAWDEACGNRCAVECGGCGLPDFCGDGTCTAGLESCGDCPDDCSCPAGEHCVEGLCLCQPQCDDKDCGFDGCGGECGTCSGEQAFCVQGTCICQPLCGPSVCGDDGCGGSCGECSGGLTCAGGLCVGGLDVLPGDTVTDIQLPDIGPTPSAASPAPDTGCCAGGANGPLGFALGIFFSLLISWAFARRRTRES